MNQKLLLSKLGRIKRSARELRILPSKKKNSVLLAAAEFLIKNQNKILKANQKDLKNAQQNLKPAFIDRLTLTEDRILHMAESLRQVAKLPDPVGEIIEKKRLPHQLLAQRVRSPLGVIFMIFESRPNVVIEAFSLAFKSGNGLILRGGKEASETTRSLYQLLGEALTSQGVPSDCFWGIHDPDREIPQFLLSQKQWIDVVVPRGGDGLIDFVTKNSQIPIIKNDRGLCHIYVDKDADLEMAKQIVFNAKTQRPGVCNAMETLLIHQKVAPKFLPQLYETLSTRNVLWYGCPKSQAILKGKKLVKKAKESNWNTEYLDFNMNSRVVSSMEDAIAHIEKYGSKHSEAIITRSKTNAEHFQREVDAAAVYWNASTRFTDGFELGLGGELGISTQKLHVRGPVGLKELTSVRWVITGKGQIRK